jgi:hypothetical protein
MGRMHDIKLCSLLLEMQLKREQIQTYKYGGGLEIFFSLDDEFR